IPERFGAELQLVPRTHFRQALSEQVTDRSTIVVLTNSHNPTGHWFKDRELKEIADLVVTAAPDAVTVVDETFRDLTSAKFATAATIHPKIISINSLSKSFGLPGIRCGWITVHKSISTRFLSDWI